VDVAAIARSGVCAARIGNESDTFWKYQSMMHISNYDIPCVCREGTSRGTLWSRRNLQESDRRGLDYINIVNHKSECKCSCLGDFLEVGILSSIEKAVHLIQFLKCSVIENVLRGDMSRRW
jgi:hypothetical protein